MPEMKEQLTEKQAETKRWEEETLNPVIEKRAERKESFEGMFRNGVNALWVTAINSDKPKRCSLKYSSRFSSTLINFMGTFCLRMASANTLSEETSP